MNRVMIIGSGGAGKSTLAKQLGSLKNLPVIHLDYYYWKPNWVETKRPVWIEKQQALMAGERWVIDGNYSATYNVRTEKADTIVYLDFNRFKCLYGVINRRFQYAGKSRPDTGDNCPERLDFVFLKWIWDYPKKKRPIVLKLLEEHKTTKTIIVLSNRREVSQWLQSLSD